MESPEPPRISELKERLMRHLGITAIDLTMLVPTGDEVVF